MPRHLIDFIAGSQDHLKHTVVFFFVVPNSELDIIRLQCIAKHNTRFLGIMKRAASNP